MTAMVLRYSGGGFGDGYEAQVVDSVVVIVKWSRVWLELIMAEGCCLLISVYGLLSIGTGFA